MDTATANPIPVLVDKSKGIHMGEGHGDGCWEEEEQWIEFYDNCDGTYTKKVVRQISKHTANEENTHTHKTKEIMTNKEYFKRKLAGTLYT